MSPITRVRVLVADDHPVSRIGLVAILGASGRIEVVGEADSVATAVEGFRSCRPDVVLLDLRLPDGTGLDATARIRALDPNARVIILTAYDAEEQAYRAMKAEVNGYLLKSVAPEALIEAVCAVAQGRTILASEWAAVASQRHDDELTPREFDVLRCLIEGHTNVEIGVALGMGTGTVRTHVSNILRKLGVSDRTEAATAALRRGIV